MRDFAKQMKNKITRKYRRKPPKKGFLDYPSSDTREEERWAGRERMCMSAPPKTFALPHS